MQLLLMQICEEYALLIVLWIYVKEILLLSGLLKGESQNFNISMKSLNIVDSPFLHQKSCRILVQQPLTLY